MSKKEKPNCYNCTHRGTVPGSAHSSCRHPKVKSAADDAFGELMSIFASVGRTPPVVVGTAELNIRANPHGIKSGWFNYPWNFDPVWLENCDGFTEKSK